MPEPASRTLQGVRIKRRLLSLLVVLAAVAAFLPALDNALLPWDDHPYITANRWIRALGWENLRWMLTAHLGGLWQPATWLSLALDWRLWGLEPCGYHLTNILLHAAAAWLFYRVCLRLLGSPEAAALAALFFAVHPLRVESVAWAAERKDVLSGVFFMAAALFRLQGRDRLALPAFALALAAKVSTVTLPLVLLVLEVYPLRRLPADPRRWLERPCRPVLLSLAPYLGLACGALALSSAAVSAAGVLVSWETFGPEARLGQAIYGLVFYPAKTLWPSALAPHYPPLPWFGSWSWQVFACAGLAGAAALAAWRRGPWLGVALACYGLMLLPMSGLVQGGVIMAAADRYSYLPCLPLAVLFGAAGSGSALRRGLAALWIAGLGALAWRQCAVWWDPLSFWSATVERAASPLAGSNLGIALVERGRLAEGVARLEGAVAAFPGSPLCLDNLGVALRRSGRDRAAGEAWRRGLAIQETADLDAHLGAWLAGQREEAALSEGISRLGRAVSRQPEHAPWRLELAAALARGGRAQEAEAEYRTALALEPDSGLARNNLGLLLAGQGRRDEAASQYRLAVRDPRVRALALHNWGNLLLAAGRSADAESRYREALRMEPGLAQAQVNLGNILARRGRFGEAAARYRLALKSDPGLREARVNLSVVLRGR